MENEVTPTPLPDDSQIQTFDGIEEESVVLYSPNSASLPQIYQELNAHLDKQVANLPTALQAQMKDQIFDTLLWNYIKQIPIPLDVIKQREGSKGEFYEYFDEHYTISELDRLFPGWWQEEMTTRYDPQSMAYITTGYLCVEYLLPSGIKKIRRVYVSGGAQVFAKAADKEKGIMTPSQPEDRAIASVTRWQKLAGKKLGIGVEIYHQQITLYLRKQFEDIIQHWKYPYAEKHKEVFSKMQKGKGVRDLLRAMPTAEQSKQFRTVIDALPADDPVFNFEQAWLYFIKQNSKTADLAIQNVSKGVNARLRKIEETKSESTYQ